MEKDRKKRKIFNLKYIPPHSSDLEMPYGFYQGLSETFEAITENMKIVIVNKTIQQLYLWIQWLF